MKMHFIVSVGTSIITKTEKNTKITTYDDLSDIKNTIPKPTECFSNYNKLKGYFGNRKNIGAEQKTIDHIIKSKDVKISECHFHWIVTNTKECISCASHLIHSVFSEGTNNYYLPKNLGEAKYDDFVTKGVPSLLNELAGIMDNIPPEDQVIIVPTGGYKALIPYLTIAGILYNYPIYYIYEDSNALLELPAIPLSVDNTEFRSALVLLDNIAETNENAAKPYFNALDDRFKKLMYKDDEDIYHYTAFGERLKAMYHSHPTSPLAVRVSGNTLIQHLNKYKDQFLEMTRLGETIWIGDKAPEMADHARYHHVNLLAYAELLLAPILETHSDFLSETELFLLMGVIYFHDCGHSRCMISSDDKQIPLLPTEIRNFHNFLGYQRMFDPAFHKSLERQGLKVDASTLKNIATLSLYHRKVMPLCNGSYESPDCTIFESLENTTISQDDETVRGSLILALFRIIDGMDKQIGRAGDAIEITMRAESILADLDYLKSRVDLLKNIMTDALKENTDKIFEKIRGSYIKKESTQPEDTKTQSENFCEGFDPDPLCPQSTISPAEPSEKPIYNELQTKISNNEQFPIAWEYLCAQCRLMFQALQPGYYYSDLLLKMPKVSHQVKEGKRHIVINYPENTHTDSQQKIKTIGKVIQEWFQKNMDYELPDKWGSPEKSVEGIREEYCKGKNDNPGSNEVARILKDHGITIAFQCNGSAVKCWRCVDKKK